jgi:hypothetical protein
MTVRPLPASPREGAIELVTDALKTLAVAKQSLEAGGDLGPASINALVTALACVAVTRGLDS